MNFHNNNQIKSRTIDNINNQNSSRRKPNKFSKSQTTSNLHKYELFNKKKRLKNYIINNISNSSSEKENELYDEEINYNIDSTKNIHDTTNCTNFQKDHKKDDSNTLNIEDISDKHLAQREYWLEEKNSYIQELEKKIKKQNNIISGLLNNDNSSNTKISNYQDKTNNSNSLLDYNYQNKKMVQNYGKKEQKSKSFLEEFTNNEININETTNNSIKYSNKSKTSNSINKPKDKYDTLYSKYLNLLNDFKYLNNNNNEKVANKMKNKYNSLLEENKNLKSKLKSKNKIIKNQQKEITDIKKWKTKNDEEEKDLIKNLREQTETFRKDLVLSQAMVNSLKAEIEDLKKANNSNKIKNANKKNRNNNKDDYIFDKYNFTFNNNNNQSPHMPSTNNLEKINKTNYFNNDYLSNDLIISQNNKNKLLAKVLQENNLLRNKLKKFDSFLPNFIDICDENDIEEINKENLIKKYEEKFKYFSLYIKKIKMLINEIFKDIPITLNKYLNKNNSLSEKFILSLYDLRKEYYTIRKIDEFNLDITEDEKCIKIYMNLIKLLNKELELFTNNNSNINLNDNAISNISNLSSYHINSSFINNNSRYFENEIKNENDINFINNLNNKKRLNLTDLNIGKIEEEKNNIFNLNNMENRIKLFNGEKNNKVNNRRITYITNYGNKNRNKSSFNNSYNKEYFFEYGNNKNIKFNLVFML